MKPTLTTFGLIPFANILGAFVIAALVTLFLMTWIKENSK